MTTSLRPPEMRDLPQGRHDQLRAHVVTEIGSSTTPSKPTRPLTQSAERRSLRRAVAAIAVTALIVAIVSLGVTSGDEPGSLPQIGQSTAKAAIEIIETEVMYEIVFVTLAEDATDVAAELSQLGLDITIDFVPVSPSIENRLVAMSSPAEGENLPEFADSDSGSPSKLLVPKDFDGSASLTIGRPADDSEEYLSAAMSAQMPGEALHCVLIETRTAREALPLLDGVEVEIEWRPYRTGEAYFGTVPDQYLDWYVAGTSPVAKGKVLVFLTEADFSEGVSSWQSECDE